jgi:phosphoserine aminotransferase
MRLFHSFHFIKGKIMRAYNFCAGPAALPTAVLEKAQAELLDWHGKGLSIMEMSHRSKDYVAVAEKAEADLRKLMNIPENYKVLFLQGGASLQFSAIPLNLLGKNSKADYIHTGIWSEKATQEAQRYGDIHIVEAGTTIDGKLAISEQSHGICLMMLLMFIMPIMKRLVGFNLPIFLKQ